MGGAGAAATGVAAIFLIVVYALVFLAVLAAQLVVSVLACKRLVEDKGLNRGLMWLGLLSWLGMVILCFMKKKESGQSNI